MNTNIEFRKAAEQIFLAGVKRVTPSILMPACMSLEDNILKAGQYSFNTGEFRRIYVIGAGKASAAMAAEVEKILGERISGGHIIVRYGHSCRLKRIQVAEAGHPIPDQNGFRATGAVLEIARKAEENDLVICLISGGGSALLSDFPEGSGADDIMVMNSLLVNCGADISEINAVRKHVSAVKGGQLARAVYPATLLNLMISDVAGDPLDVIASGPTVPDPTTFRHAMQVLEKYDIDIPGSLLRHLREGLEGRIPETPKEGDPVFYRTFNILAGTNSLALEAAAEKARGYNLNAAIVNTRLQGDVKSVSDYLFETAIRIKNDQVDKKPVCLLFGGETTVKMTGKGKGGRNQHLALLMARYLKDHPGVTFLSGGTDGNDGPTDAAGAVVDSETTRHAIEKNIDPEKYLAEFDSYNFFKKSGGHVITGPTLTNVMDIMVMIIR
ncbi:MAG TPA: glycerate kinase [Bacteroidales bacterium]|nr:glycerate kinase [Bacteroidales bacterium]